MRSSVALNKRRSMSQPIDDDEYDEYVTDSDEDVGGDDDDLANERDGIELDSGDEQPWEAHHGLRHLFVSICRHFGRDACLHGASVLTERFFVVMAVSCSTYQSISPTR